MLILIILITLINIAGLLYIILILFENKEWLLKLIKVILPKNWAVIAYLDCTRQVNYTLVRKVKPHIWRGQIYPISRTGILELHESGVCIKPSYAYFWQPTNKSHLMQIQLSWPEFKPLNYYQKQRISHGKLSNYHQQLLNQLNDID